MDLVKVACQVAGALNIICIIGAFPGLYGLMHLPSDGLSLLITCFVMVFVAPIVFLVKLLQTACMASICDRPFDLRKTVFHYWIAYNIVFAVGLTIYSLYSIIKLGGVSLLEDKDKDVYYLHMMICLPLSVLYSIKLAAIITYYVRRVHNSNSTLSEHLAKPTRYVDVNIHSIRS